MNLKKQNDKLISMVIKEAFQDFKKYPFDWTVNELEAQVRLYNIMDKYLKANKDEQLKNEDETKLDTITVVVKNEGTQRINPIPEYNHTVYPLRLECNVIDKCGDKRKPDIAIVNSEYSNYIEDKLERTINDESIDVLNTVMDMFIEVKIAWGYCKGQFAGEGIMKDLRLISMYKDKGYFVYFIGNDYSSMKEDMKQAYRSNLAEIKQVYDFDENQVFIVFRDQVFNGIFEAITL